jgi:hypothetical protein
MLRLYAEPITNSVVISAKRLWKQSRVTGETDELDPKFEVPAGNTQKGKINKPEPGDDPGSELI